MAGGIVDLLEAIEVEQQQRGGPAIVLSPRQQWRAAIEESAAIGDAGQRIGQRRFALLKLGAFLRHGDAQERQAKRDEQGLEGDHRNKRALRLAGGGGKCQHIGERYAYEQKSR